MTHPLIRIAGGTLLVAAPLWILALLMKAMGA